MYVAVLFQTSGSSHSASQTLNRSMLQTGAKPQNYSDQCSGACSGVWAPRQLSGQTANQLSRSSELNKITLGKHKLFVCLAFESDTPKVHPFPVLDFSVLLVLICGD